MTTTEPEAPRSTKDDRRPSPSTASRSRRKPGELLIKAAQEHGVYIPRFCWHERMKPVGMCRMCLVEVEGVRGFPPACTTPVADGMVCNTQSDAVKKIQDGVLEFLLVNHPLDCPVCDRGGECPLQDQTLAFGPGESRFVEEKRHFEKPIPLSDLVLLDRERCIQCGRCTRFADEIAGDPLIDFVDRGDRMQVLNFAEQPFDSYFSGNTVQICPVGALTASQYRFQARPWDLETVETSCTRARCSAAARCSRRRTGSCACSASTPSRSTTAGCATRVATASSGCTPSAGCSSRSAAIDGELRQVSWPEALDAAADAARDAPSDARARNRSRCSAARGAPTRTRTRSRGSPKGVIGTDNVDAQLGDGLPGRGRARPAAGRDRRLRPRGGDRAARSRPREELPVLHLRVRRAVVELGVPLVDLAPGRARALRARDRGRARSVPGEDARRGRARATSTRGARRAARSGRGGPRPRRRSRSRRPSSVRAAAALARRSRRAVPLGAAPRQRARRARRRARARVPARAG